MPDIAPTNFSSLPYELRSMIWTFTAIIQARHLADTVPIYYMNKHLDRRRLALFGYHDEKPHYYSWNPLILGINGSSCGRVLNLYDDGFEKFVNCFPLSGVCKEARFHVARFCRKISPHMGLKYFIHPNIEYIRASEEDSPLVILRDTGRPPRAEMLEHVYAQPTTLTLYGGKAEFQSAEHMAEVVNRFFGNRIERLNLEFSVFEEEEQDPFWADDMRLMDRLETLDEPVFDIEDCDDPSIIFCTPDRKIHAVKKVWCDYGWHAKSVADHLLQIYDIFRATAKTLPHLKRIDMDLNSLCVEQHRLKVDTTYKDGILYASLDNSETRTGESDFTKRFINYRR